MYSKGNYLKGSPVGSPGSFPSFTWSQEALGIPKVFPYFNASSIAYCLSFISFILAIEDTIPAPLPSFPLFHPLHRPDLSFCWVWPGEGAVGKEGRGQGMKGS